jgi:two-component system KDP operon response regulator KdpE
MILEVYLMKILVIDDDEKIIEFIALILNLGWPEAKLVSTTLGEKGIQLVDTESPNIVILDLGLPDINGFEVLKQIRQFSSVPIIVLTVSDEESDIVKALEWGANEYVVKPFRQMELLARLKSLVRKHDATPLEQNKPEYKIGLWNFDSQKHILKNNAQKTIYLTRTESTILQHLVRNIGKVVTIQSLTNELWDEYYPGAIEAIRVYIRRLRKKIETEPGAPQVILTEPGIGYVIKKSP